jgi:hypothetical protein
MYAYFSLFRSILMNGKAVGVEAISQVYIQPICSCIYVYVYINVCMHVYNERQSGRRWAKFSGIGEIHH